MVDFRYIIGNINNIDFQPGPLPPSFRTFNTTDTKTPKGPRNNEHRKQPSRNCPEKAKDIKFKINPHLVNGKSETLKS